MRFAATALLILVLLTACGTNNDGEATPPATSPAPAGTPAPEPAPTRSTATPAEPASPSPTAGAAQPSPQPTDEPAPEPTPPGPPRVTTVVEGVTMPSALTFTPDGRMLFIEVYAGRIRVVENGRLLPRPFAEIDVAQPPGYTEHGLLGLAIDPSFAENRFVYAFYTIPDAQGSPAGQRIVRFTEQDNAGADLTVIVDDLPAGPTCCHNGGRLAFGPDGKLYVTLGDVQNADLSQDPRNVAGGILRYNPDGSIPDDNPFPGSPTWAYGLRNPFGIAFHPATGQLFATENGPRGRDELNLIERGGNYGWPIVTGPAGDPRFIDPLWTSDDSRAPTGIVIPDSPLLPGISGDVVFCEWLTGTLNVFRLERPGNDRVVAREQLPGQCRLDVIQGNDGALYFSDQDTIYRYGPSSP